ncbi:DUF4256 domain-containing protein [Leptospira biflexa]|uniref:DUF4256 domain-containing protein n=1 Tax=Leptospira biflexa TaxID=172 RepID=UPI0010827012|nr:DUF4256 domain-containing protein [Leptospira biflexa]TGM37861.1 DUF4256 domain-containing protein [Leptospira biflexa]TGM41194.1 DUF4256 domain-containing protein [Leptospira biflexa]TGM55407.1 DUF4256 domain-containing protein [Leptospira biflexa]
MNQDTLLLILKERFESHPIRHKGIKWDAVEEKLKKNPDKIKSLIKMEESGGEPDVVLFDKKNNSFTFYDCSAESPSGRRSFCYDKEALQSRKEHKPKSSAIEFAKTMGTKILNEEEYRYLQTLGEFDKKTSSWIETPTSIRKLGGAIFCDYRYGTVFLYHNGAESYYAVRGFRSSLTV